MSRPDRAGWRPMLLGRPLMVWAVLALPLAAGGCSNARDVLGLSKKSPDEFSVVTKAPLVMPPAFGLRPPEPGAARPNEQAPRDRAAAALGGGPVSGQPAGPRSPGEAALLQQARATNVDPDIRRKVNDEFTQLAERDSRLVDRLIFWQAEARPGTPLDPTKEAQRLRENAATGKPLTAGEVPLIKRRERGPLEGIF
jgi:hypothetical protein